MALVPRLYGLVVNENDAECRAEAVPVDVGIGGFLVSLQESWRLPGRNDTQQRWIAASATATTTTTTTAVAAATSAAARIAESLAGVVRYQTLVTPTFRSEGRRIQGSRIQPEFQETLYPRRNSNLSGSTPDLPRTPGLCKGLVPWPNSLHLHPRSEARTGLVGREEQEGCEGSQRDSVLLETLAAGISPVSFVPAWSILPLPQPAGAEGRGACGSLDRDWPVGVGDSSALHHLFQPGSLTRGEPGGAAGPPAPRLNFQMPEVGKRVGVAKDLEASSPLMRQRFGFQEAAVRP